MTLAVVFLAVFVTPHALVPPAVKFLGLCRCSLQLPNHRERSKDHRHRRDHLDRDVPRGLERAGDVGDGALGHGPSPWVRASVVRGSGYGSANGGDGFVVALTANHGDAPAVLLEDQLDGEPAGLGRGGTGLDAVVVVAVDRDRRTGVVVVRVAGAVAGVMVMRDLIMRLTKAVPTRRLALVDGLEGHVPAPVGSHRLLMILVLVVAGRGGPADADIARRSVAARASRRKSSSSPSSNGPATTVVRRGAGAGGGGFGAGA